MSSRLLVIDASVVVGGGAPSQTMAVLDTILKVCHRIVLTDECLAEYREHVPPVRYYWRWQRMMYARKKVVRDCLETLDASCERWTKGVVPAGRDAMRKDAHLVHAALRADGILISADERARALYARAATKSGELRKLIWVNPREADIVRWLATGASVTSKRVRTLGA